MGGSGGVGVKLMDMTWLLCLTCYILGKEALASNMHTHSCVSNSSFRASSWTYPQVHIRFTWRHYIKKRYKQGLLSQCG